MANGYFVGLLALFVLYSFIHHKKVGFYEDDSEAKNTSKSYEPGKTNFIPIEIQNEMYSCIGTKEPPTCDPEIKYRRIDAYCTNLANPLWGGAHTSYTRVGDAFFDGPYALRKSVKNGDLLPLGRKLGTTVLSEKKVLSDNNTMLLSTFGQIVSHDVSGGKTKEGAGCCFGLDRESDEYDVLCCQIDIPEDDPFFSKLNRTCIELYRQYNTYNDANCTYLTYPYMELRVTSYLDLSFLYGYDAENSVPVRAYVGGRLVSNITDVGPVLPLQEGECPQPGAAKSKSDLNCFLGGDGRLNLNPEVVIYTLIFFRSHNHIAKELEKLHPEWNDTILFEEARRINIAAYQRVIYNEFLPSIIGKENCKNRGLLEEEEGYSDQYDPEVNAQTIVEFSTGVFRAFHTLLPGSVIMRNNDYEPISQYRSMDHFDDQTFLINEPRLYTPIINGLVANKAIKKIGKFGAVDFMDFLNNGDDNGTLYATDLFAIDITRGRDHGIPPYNAMRRYCGLRPITSFDQLTNANGTRLNVVKQLEELYNDIEDLDLLIGVYLETKVPTALFGSTGKCLIEEAFSRYKKGDRFFYEFNNTVAPFTEDQLKAIKQVTFSSLICLAQNNSELEMQEDPLHQPSPTNPKKKCADYPFLDLSSF